MTQERDRVAFDTEPSVITNHLRNVFKSGTLTGRINMYKICTLQIAPNQKAMGSLCWSSCAIYSAALQAGSYLENMGGLAHDSVVAFFGTDAANSRTYNLEHYSRLPPPSFPLDTTNEESSVVQEECGHKTRRWALSYNLAMGLSIAKSPPEEKDVLTRVLVNPINRRNR